MADSNPGEKTAANPGVRAINAVGFASLAWRVDDLPNALWLRESPPDGNDSADDAASEKSAPNSGTARRFDDGSYPAPRKKFRPKLAHVVIFVACTLILIAIFKPDRPEPPPKATPATVAYVEQTPPAGTDNFLSTPQIRFCKYEKVRLEVMSPLINNRLAEKKFSDRVEQYSSRCANFKYKADALQSVQDELATMRPILAEAATKTVKGWDDQFNDWSLVRPYRNLPFSYREVSIKRVNNIAQGEFMWTETIYKQTPRGLSYKSIQTMRFFDCGEKTFATVAATYFDDSAGRGAIVEKIAPVVPKKINFEPIPPGSAAQEHMNIACGGSK